MFIKFFIYFLIILQVFITFSKVLLKNMSTTGKGEKKNRKVKFSEINKELLKDIHVGEINNDADLKRELKRISDNFFNDHEMGFIKRIGDGIAFVVGMEGVAAGELIYIPQANNMQGMALNSEIEGVGVVSFGSDQLVYEGLLVCRTRKSVFVNVGFFLLGRVLDGLGFAIDNLGVFEKGKELRVDIKAPGIIARKSVHEPVQTGIKAVDSLLPIGRGQRELIIGDRQTGKTALAIDTIINQRYYNL